MTSPLAHGKYTPTEAVVELLHQAWNERARRRSDYLRCCKALQALGINESAQVAPVLRELNYTDGFGVLRDRYHIGWKAKKAQP